MQNHQRIDGRGFESAKIGAAFALLLVMLWIPENGLRLTEGRIVGSAPSAYIGDEPHYVLVVHSLLFDRDLNLKNNYASALRGGWDAGRLWRGRPIAHQTILFEPDTGEHALWLDKCRWKKVDRCWPIDMRTTDALLDQKFPHIGSPVERSGHPIAFPVVAAAAIAASRPARNEVEARLGLLMGLIGWLGIVLTYRTGRAINLSARSALGAAALLALASAWLPYTRSFYPATLAGLSLIIALLSIVKKRIVMAALAISYAAALKPILSVVAISWMIVLLFQRRWQSASTFGLCVGLCGAALGLFNYWTTGTPMVFGVVTPRASFNTGEALLATLLSPSYGLIVFVPWAIVGFIYLARSTTTSGTLTPVGWASIGIVPILILLALFPYLGANCYGPRYWIPFLPWLAIACAAQFQASNKLARSCIVILAVAGALVAIPGTILYPSVWDRPPHIALDHLLNRW